MIDKTNPTNAETTPSKYAANMIIPGVMISPRNSNLSSNRNTTNDSRTKTMDAIPKYKGNFTGNLRLFFSMTRSPFSGSIISLNIPLGNEKTR